MPDTPRPDTSPDTHPDTRPAEPKQAQQPLRCDFCGEPSPRVRRVALDVGYDRLQTPHRVQYACPSCSEAKERERQGLTRS